MKKEKLYFDSDTIIACTELAAKYFGVSAATLSNWENAGCPKKDYGYWDIKAVEGYRQERAGVKAAEAAEDDPSKLTLTQQKLNVETLLKTAQLEATTLRNEIAQGKYLVRAEVVQHLTELMLVLKSSLFGLQAELAREVVPLLADESDERRVTALIGGVVNDALQQMSVDGVYSGKK